MRKRSLRNRNQKLRAACCARYSLPGEGTGCRDDVHEDGPVDQYLMTDQAAEIALARSAAPKSIYAMQRYRFLDSWVRNGGERQERLRVHRGTRVDICSGS